MRVTLPISDPTPTEGESAEVPGIERIYDGGTSLTQRIVEQVMEQDFPAVAALGIRAYVHRLSHIVYTTGFQVFWLDRLPELPGYTVCTMEPPVTLVAPDGGLQLSITHLTGPKAAHRAEQVRRWIPPGQTHT